MNFNFILLLGAKPESRKYFTYVKVLEEDLLEVIAKRLCIKLEERTSMLNDKDNKKVLLLLHSTRYISVLLVVTHQMHVFI